MAAENYLEEYFIDLTVNVLPDGRKVIFAHGDKAPLVLRQIMHLAYSRGQTYLCGGGGVGGDASVIFANFTVKKLFMVTNPFLSPAGYVEKGFKALFTSAALVGEKNKDLST